MAEKILVIDDEELHFDIIRDLLTSKEVVDEEDLVLAKDADKGLELILREPHKYVVTIDRRMPKKNGFEIIEQIRKIGVDITCILTSSMPITEAERNRASELGAVNCFWFSHITFNIDGAEAKFIQIIKRALNHNVKRKKQSLSH